MKYIQNLISKADLEAFASRLSNVLLTDHAIKLKPIKLLHCIAKALGFKNYNHYQAVKVPRSGLQHFESAELEQKLPAGVNTYIVGGCGSGKTTMSFGIIIDSVNNSFQKFSNTVVLDIGRSYQHLHKKLADSEFIVATAKTSTTLNAIETSGKSVTFIELEELKAHRNEHIAKQLVDILKKITNKRSLLIIDEWWEIHQYIKEWALTEFEGHARVIAMAETDLTYDKSQHLFNYGVKIERHFFK
tara:strand:- start:6758 stop:7492 length:735 start_codon:yes stop_codon:yes gene_type:complete